MFSLHIANIYGGRMTHVMTDDSTVNLDAEKGLSLDWHPMAKSKFFNEKAAEEFNQDDSFEDRANPRKKQRTMLENENMKKDNEQILSIIATKETKLSQLKSFARTEFDRHTEDMKKIVEEISQSEERKEQCYNRGGSQSQGFLFQCEKQQSRHFREGRGGGG